METVLAFAFERAFVNLATILLGFGVSAWLLGGRLKARGFGPAARSLMYSLFGTTGGLLSYYSYDFARDDRQLLAFALVGGAMFVLCFTIAFQSRGLLLATPRR